MKQTLQKFWQHIVTNKILVFILLVSAALRLYRIQDYMTYLGDEGRDDVVVYNILHGHLTLLGPTSSVGGFFLGPIYYYMMAPFLWIFHYNPVGPAVMVALLSVATVWLLYYIGNEFFNKTAGLIAAAFYAISPLVIIYAHSSWNPNPVPFFTLLLFYVLYKATNKNSEKLFLLSGFLLGILIQLHYLATFIGVIVAVYMLFYALLFQKKDFVQKIYRLIKNYLLVLIGFLVGWSPLIVFEFRHQFQNFKNIYTFIFFSKDTGGGSHFLSTVWDVFVRVFGRLVTALPQSQNFHLYQPFIINAWLFLTLIIAAISIYYLLRYKKREQQLLLLCWLIVGVVLFGFYKKTIYDYYLGFLFPLPFLLVGYGLSNLLNIKKSSLFFQVISIVLILILVLLNLANSPVLKEPNSLTTQTKIIANAVLSKTDNKPYNFALIAANNTDYAYKYYFILAKHPPVTIDNFANDQQRKTVTSQLLVVCEDLPCDPPTNPLWQVAGFGESKVIGEWDVDHVKIYKLIHAK